MAADRAEEARAAIEKAEARHSIDLASPLSPGVALDVLDAAIFRPLSSVA